MTNPGQEKTQEELFEDRVFQDKIRDPTKGQYPIQLLKALIEILKPWKKGKNIF